MKKQILATVFTGLVICGLIALSMYLGNSLDKANKKVVDREQTIVNIQTALIEPEEIKTKYNFIDCQKAIYIEQLSVAFEVDPDLSFGLLMTENPRFDEKAININDNGTTDEGLYQLNDRYFWTTFVPNYWKFDIDCDPFNWKHNAYIAISHIAYLQNKLKVTDDVIMAYNCGEGAVMNHNIPARTKVYLASVNNNIKMLKSID